MKRLPVLFALAASALCSVANAQAQSTAVSPALEVQRLAPQLVGFAGGELNFANLVNGLALGLPVTLTTPLPEGGNAGGMQVFTFAPAGTMTSVQVAQLLESARQSLIARGIATPSAQQLGTTLSGGTLATAARPAPVGPSVTGATQSPANAIQNANSTVNAMNAAAGSTAAPRNTSDSPLPRGVADTPPLPVPGFTQPLQGNATEAKATERAMRPIAPTAPAVRGGDR